MMSEGEKHIYTDSFHTMLMFKMVTAPLGMTSFNINDNFDHSFFAVIFETAIVNFQELHLSLL